MIAWFWAQVAQAVLLLLWGRQDAGYELLLDKREGVSDADRRKPSPENIESACRQIERYLIEVGAEVPAEARRYAAYWGRVVEGRQ